MMRFLPLVAVVFALCLAPTLAVNHRLLKATNKNVVTGPSSFRFAQRPMEIPVTVSLPPMDLSEDPFGCEIPPKPTPTPDCSQQQGSPCPVDAKLKAIADEENTKKNERLRLECIYATVSHIQQQINTLDYYSSAIRSKYDQALYQKELIRNAVSNAQQSLQKLIAQDRDDIIQMEKYDEIKAKQDNEFKKQTEEAQKKDRQTMFEREKKHAELLQEESKKSEQIVKLDIAEQTTKKKEGEEREKQKLAEETEKTAQAVKASQLAQKAANDAAAAAAASRHSESSHSESSHSESSESSALPPIRDPVKAKLLPGAQTPLTRTSPSFNEPKIVDQLISSESASPPPRDDRVEADTESSASSSSSPNKNEITVHIHNDGKVTKKF